MRIAVNSGVRRLVRAAWEGSPKPPSLVSMTLDQDDVDLVQEWLRRRDAWHDPAGAQEFEAQFARWNGSKYAFAFMSGRVALSACLYALGLQAGDAMILPGYTCVVVPNALAYAGVKAVFSDIELDTYGLDVSQLGEKITVHTRAILLHHLYGLVCRDYDAIIRLAARQGLRVIEDCAHSAGAEYYGVKVGNRGDLAFYSTERSKVLNTIVGGVAVTNDPQLAQRLKAYQVQAPYPEHALIECQLRNVALDYYEFKCQRGWWRRSTAVWNGVERLEATTTEELRGIRPPHYGQKMPLPVAMVGLNQLKKIDRYNAQRRVGAERWERWCKASGYQPPYQVSGSRPIYLRYPVLVESERKQDVSWAEQALAVDLGTWFVSHTHPVSRPVTGCPHADQAVRRCVNFPTLLS